MKCGDKEVFLFFIDFLVCNYVQLFRYCEVVLTLDITSSIILKRRVFRCVNKSLAPFLGLLI